MELGARELGQRATVRRAGCCVLIVSTCMALSRHSSTTKFLHLVLLRSLYLSSIYLSLPPSLPLSVSLSRV